MQVYISRYGALAGTTYAEAMRSARREYQKIQAHTKRQPYVRSRYFNGDKVFVNIFFNHLVQKRKGEQLKRTKLFLCAIDLLRNSTVAPDTIFKRDTPNEALHRFAGVTRDGRMFYVQVKQSKRSGRKDFMSVFPARRQK